VREIKREGEKGMRSLAEFWLNLNKSKFDPSGVADWLRDDFKWIARHPPSFNIFGQVEIGFWMKSLFSNMRCKNKV
jgi:hypothetical protein